MQDNLACIYKYLCPFLSFFMLPSLLKRIYTDIRVVPRLYYTVTKGRPEWVFRSGMKTPVNFIKVDMATRWTIKHGLMLLWFTDLINVTEEVTIHRPNVSTLLSSAFIRGDLNAATRGPFI